ncbi:MAG TPA: hypothetical protein VLA77_03005 [Candidatus Saccharimonadales bacterium]|nr:hypothetical protein [Candidatus Saccharimonadales bacterium]
MIGLNHALTGAAIGIAVREPLLVVPLAFASHFALDVIPHFGGHQIYTWGNKHFTRIIIADGIACLSIISLIITLNPSLALPVLLGVFFAMLPDALLVHYYTKKPLNNWFHNFHLNLQWYEKPQGIVVEALYLLLISPAILYLLT